MAAELERRNQLETIALPMRPFILGAVSVLAFLLLSIVSLWLVFLPNTSGRVQSLSQTPSGNVQLQADPSVERNRVLDEQRKQLAGYHWIDRSRGFFSIPIDRAMALIAARGADAYAPIAQPPGAKP